MKKGFELSEATNTPVMLEVRIRACHVHGRFATSDNVRPSYTLRDAMENPRRQTDRIVLPPASYLHEKEKIEKRWPAAVKFIEDNKLNEFFDGDLTDIGIVMQGGMYNTTLRALELAGLADSLGHSRVPLYVMNVTYPLIDRELIRFAEGKRAILIVEEGQPEFLEQAINTIFRRADMQTRIEGKGMLPMAGEYTGGVVRDGVKAFVRKYRPDAIRATRRPSNEGAVRLAAALKGTEGHVHPRPPSFCTGCPERPIFTALKLVERELGPHHVSCDIGCHLFSILPPFNIGATTMGYGLGGAGAAAFNTKSDKRAIAFVGDGGFWHNGLTSSIGNAVFNKSDNVTIIVDNGYTSATGGQDILSSYNRQQDPQDAELDREGGARRRRRMGAHADAHLRRRRHARHLARGADHQGKRPEGHRGAVGMHAEQAAPRAPADEQGDQGRQARGARALRRRCRHLHRRSLVHPPLRLPVAHRRAEPRSVAHRAGDEGDQLLRRLRAVRRGRARGGAVPVVLSRLDHQQSDRLGSLQGDGCAAP